MRRGQLVTIGELKPGDRFYKYGGKTKTACEFIKEWELRHD